MSDLFLQLSKRLFWTRPVLDAVSGNLRWQDSKLLTIRHSEWHWSFLKVVVFAGGPYFFINLQYVSASLIAVGLNWSQPEDWPPYFGRVSHVTTVRYFWGSFWHQTLRRSFTMLTAFFVDLLKVPRGTKLAFHLKIWIAFAVSGFMHAQAMLLLPSPKNITIGERTKGMMAFFLWQAAAISVEDCAKCIYIRTEPFFHLGRPTLTIVGYAWVVMSFWISLPWAGDVMMRMRLTEESFLSFSIFNDFVRYVPIPP
ncbi:hypothetical protein N0V93_004596 [Gnomoniopsis smithogilvyi]|uniref:Wax synthase domain-containing protein n=1 Tax=Gnomoniopsis smithogilvyi TaxID=1191159 RepID=A0A9W8YRD3_9PEZI|nr:hypothetical protein N0V93_004596 [Gnomoniopsis smithogilvyi]